MTRCTKKKKLRIVDSGKMNSLEKRFTNLIEINLIELDRAIANFLQVQESDLEEAKEHFHNIDNEITKEYQDIYLTAQTWLQAGDITQFQYDHLGVIEQQLRADCQQLLTKYGITPGETK